MAKENPFVKFHIKQGLVLVVIELIIWLLRSMFWPYSYFMFSPIQIINLAVIVFIIAYLCFSWIYICYTIFLYIRIYTSHTVNKLKSSILVSLFFSFFILSSTENLLAVRVHESFRMNLTFWFLVLYALGSLTQENERLT